MSAVSVKRLVLAVVLLLAATTAQAVVTRFQKAATVTSTTITTDTASISIGTGHGVVCVTMGQTSNETLTSGKITDSQGNTNYTVVNSGSGVQGPGVGNWVYLFYRPNFSSTTNFTVTVTWASSYSFLALACVDVSNMAASPTTNTQTGSGTSTAITTASAVTCSGTCIIVAGAVANSAALSSYNGYTGSNTSGNAVWNDAYHDGVTTNESPNFTQSSNTYAIIATSFTETGGAAVAPCVLTLLGVGQC